MPTTPTLKTRLGVGAAAVLAAGPMAAAAFSAASASTTSPTPSAASTAAPSARAKTSAHAGLHGLGSFLQIKAYSQQAAGDRATRTVTALQKSSGRFHRMPGAALSENCPSYAGPNQGNPTKKGTCPRTPADPLPPVGRPGLTGYFP